MTGPPCFDSCNLKSDAARRPRHIQARVNSGDSKPKVSIGQSKEVDMPSGNITIIDRIYGSVRNEGFSHVLQAFISYDPYNTMS